jgi:hypothetical protein
MLAKGIEDIFMGLAEDAVIDIIGNIPDPMKIGLSDYAVMNEVISHIMNYKSAIVQENYTYEPDFDKKIEFNALSRSTTSILEAGVRSSHILDEYFKRNSEYTRSEIRDRFKTLYEQAKAEIQNSLIANTNNSDSIFFYIVGKASPRHNFLNENAVYVLMAYYFAACDIYEQPTK